MTMKKCKLFLILFCGSYFYYMGGRILFQISTYNTLVHNESYNISSELDNNPVLNTATSHLDNSIGSTEMGNIMAMLQTVRSTTDSSLSTETNAYDQLFSRPFPKECPSNLICVRMKGRLGNQMGMYASIWGLTRGTNRAPCVIPSKGINMSEYFEKLSIPSLNDISLDEKCNLQMSPHDRFHDEDLILQKLKSQEVNNIKIVDYPNRVDIFHPYRDEIRKEFQFNDEIMVKVQNHIKNIEYCKNKNCTYIGVHVRRTDYADWLHSRVSGKLVGATYLYKAMQLMKSKFFDAIFIVLSDDMGWCKENLNFPEFHVEFLGPSEPIIDMAILSVCNHSILTHGTFGFWGGYLSGGDIIQPTNFSKELPGPQKDVLKAKIKGWTMLSSR